MLIQNRGRTVAIVTAQEGDNAFPKRGPLDGFLEKMELVRKRHRIRGVASQKDEVDPLAVARFRRVTSMRGGVAFESLTPLPARPRLFPDSVIY